MDRSTLRARAYRLFGEVGTGESLVEGPEPEAGLSWVSWGAHRLRASEGDMIDVSGCVRE